MSLSDMICVGLGELGCVYEGKLYDLYKGKICAVCKMMLENVLGAMTDARGSFNAYDVMSKTPAMRARLNRLLHAFGVSFMGNRILPFIEQM
jgi:hypothetical protein